MNTHPLKIEKDLLEQMNDDIFLECYNKVEQYFCPTVEEYNNQSDYLKYRGKCKEYCEELVAEHTSLRLVRGFFHEPLWSEKQQHWWCEKPDGTIVDPTVKQFPSWKVALSSPTLCYEEFDGICTCDECGKLVKEEDA